MTEGREVTLKDGRRAFVYRNQNGTRDKYKILS